MQEVKGLLSVVIPAYNAEPFLEETIQSVKNQSYSNWEMIIVDDGSADATASVAAAHENERVRLLRQKNSGVSAARNNGFKVSRGEFILFLDADDVLSVPFAEKRIDFLKKNPEYGYAGGMIQQFPGTAALIQAVAENPSQQILFFEKGFATVPSNYIFRKEILVRHNLLFNTRLNSTADRFFLLQLAKHTIGKSIWEESGKLFYRVNANSMSHKVSKSLMMDNARFYEEIKIYGLLPAHKPRQFSSMYFFSLAAGFAKVKLWGKVFQYLFKSFSSSPAFFYRKCFSKIAGKKRSNVES